MQELKKISLKVLSLISDITLLGYKVIRQVNLPSSRKKGNLLNSIFIFFIGIIERLNIFEHGIFSIAAIFKKRYVKETILIVGFILFHLSVLESNVDHTILKNAQIERKEQPTSTILLKEATFNNPNVLCFFCQKNLCKLPFEFYAKIPNTFSNIFPVKRFIFIHGLRI